MKKKIGGFLKTFGKGLLKEAVSYIPIVGDNLANSIDKGIGKQISDDTTDTVVEVIGKVIVGGLVISVIAGWIDMETAKELLKLVGF